LGVNMKGLWKTPKMIIAFSALVLAAVVTAALAVSCATTGAYKPLVSGETVLGTVAVSFEVRGGSLFAASFSKKGGRDAVNTQAYIKLLETAQRKFPGNIDIRDIVWVTGKSENQNTEVSAVGKVIEAPN